MTIAIIVIASVAGAIGVTAGIVSICTCMHTKKVLSTQSDQKTTVNVENETVNEEFVPPTYPKFLQITNGNKDEQEGSLSYSKQTKDGNETIIEMEMEENEKDSTHDNSLKPKKTINVNPKYNNTDKYGTGDLTDILAHHSNSNIVKRTKITQKINITNVDHKNIFSSEKTHQTGMHNDVANTLADVPGTVLGGLTSLIGGGGGGNGSGLVSTVTEGIKNKFSSKQDPKPLQQIRFEEIEEEEEEEEEDPSPFISQIPSPSSKFEDYFEEDDNNPPMQIKSSTPNKNYPSNKNITKVQNNHKTNSLPVVLTAKSSIFETNSNDDDVKNNYLDTKSEIIKKHANSNTHKSLTVPTKHQRKSSFSEKLKNQISNQIEEIEEKALNQISNIFNTSPTFGAPQQNTTFNHNDIFHVDISGSSEDQEANDSSDE